MGLAIATGVGLVGGMAVQARVEATHHQGRSFEYTMLGDTFVPLPRKEVQHALGAFAGAGALAAAGSRLSGRPGALGAAGTAMSSLGVGFLAGQALVFVMP